jgi:exodeoxyribonuclease VII large subunit
MKILLTVPAEDAERALTLGALFDEADGSYFVPAGTELAQFQPWLPVGTSASALTIPTQKGVSLTQLLSRVSDAVSVAFPRSEWVKLEIATLRSNGGHLYFDAVDRAPDGRELSKAKAIIWSRIVDQIGRKFFDATGASLENGLKVLVLAKAQFHSQHGFSLTITDIDPEYTLGDMQARLKRIREALVAAGIADNNKRLPSPVDFTHVAVVAPAGAAGLQDFEVEAKRLHSVGLCRFSYFHAVFQGEGAKPSLKQAIIDAHTCHTKDPIDALVIIRGGGATTDLQWLNEELLAKMICRFHVPVITGIGHERDTTILDECAHKNIGTPSKAIGYIRDVIATRASRALEDWQFICQTAEARLLTIEGKADRLNADVSALTTTRLDRATHLVEQDFSKAQSAAVNLLDIALERAGSLYSKVVNQASSQTEMAEKEISHLSGAIKNQAMNEVDITERNSQNYFDSVILAARRSIDGINDHIEEYRRGIMSSACNFTMRLDEESDRHFSDVQHFANRILDTAENKTQETIATILAHGVERTLNRGFAIVTENGKPVSSRLVAETKQDLSIQFKDGTLNVTRKKD